MHLMCLTDELNPFKLSTRLPDQMAKYRGMVASQSNMRHSQLQQHFIVPNLTLQSRIMQLL